MGNEERKEERKCIKNEKQEVFTVCVLYLCLCVNAGATVVAAALRFFARTGLLTCTLWQTGNKSCIDMLENEEYVAFKDEPDKTWGCEKMRNSEINQDSDHHACMGTPSHFKD